MFGQKQLRPGQFALHQQQNLRFLRRQEVADKPVRIRQPRAAEQEAFRRAFRAASTGD